MENQTWIRLQVNTFNQFQNLDALAEKLKEEYTVQVHTHWEPACVDGTEFFVQILQNIKSIDFWSGTLIGSVAFDLVKGSLKRFWNSLSDFLKINQDANVRIQFILDDVTIDISDLSFGNYGYYLSLIKNVPSDLKYLHQQGINDIVAIEIAYHTDSFSNSISFGMDDQNPDNLWYRIESSFGCEISYYNPKSKDIIEG